MFAIVAFVLFVIAAVLCFFASDLEIKTIIGVISAGLAALALSGEVVSGWITRARG